MPQIISSNSASMVAQTNLNKASSTYSHAINQLSSGKKVATAADNSAGLAISGRMQSQINGSTQAIANSNDGIALAQTADSALSQITSNLQQVRTLAVQSANSTYSASDRASLNQQAQQLLTQVNTVATQTQYNGQTLLDGSFGTAVFQTGANAGQTSTVNLNQGVKTSQIGQTAAATNNITGQGLAGKTLTVQVGQGRTYEVGSAVGGDQAGQDANSAFAAVTAINGANISGLTATATNTQMFKLNGEANGALKGSAGDTINMTVNGVKVFGDSGYTFGTANDNRLSSGDLVSQINSVSGQTGVSASLNKDGTLQMTATDGRNITVSQTGGKDVINEHSGNGRHLGEALQGTVSLSASSEINLGGTGAASIDGGASKIGLGSNTLAKLDLSTADGAVKALQSLDSALSTVSTLQGSVGAIQNRFDSTISNLNSVTQNVKSAQSTITDADYSSVASTLSTADVLQQAGVSMVSKANQIPQEILKLVTG
ncbi:flagellin [Robbsia sp. KACC 23696]|uniref:flagellin N-terminal helical domain-containing protein n=1 Tax=Robbsia sp. KACC 23696 TaxID=3149231 RepID=UPI00325B6C37